jgi:hypothetical protein
MGAILLAFLFGRKDMDIDERYRSMTIKELSDLFDTLTNTMVKVAGVIAEKVKEADVNRL